MLRDRSRSLLDRADTSNSKNRRMRMRPLALTLALAAALQLLPLSTRATECDAARQRGALELFWWSTHGWLWTETWLWPVEDEDDSSDHCTC